MLTHLPVAHPNVPELFIRVQTDGTITPKEAVIQVCKNLINQLSLFSQRFTREFELRRMVDAGEANNNAGNNQQNGGA